MEERGDLSPTGRLWLVIETVATAMDRFFAPEELVSG
jgi:hypothetical protein